MTGYNPTPGTTPPTGTPNDAGMTERQGTPMTFQNTFPRTPGNPYGTPYPTAPESAPIVGCGFGMAIARFWKGYVRFTGRASRSEYWFAYLFLVIVNVALGILSFVLRDTDAGAVASAAAPLWSIATFLPTLAVSWRRLHDSNHSGLLMLIVYGLTVVGALMFVFGIVGLIGGTLTGFAGDLDIGALGNSVIIVVLAFIAYIAAFITNVILMCLTPNPAGARFDR